MQLSSHDIRMKEFRRAILRGYSEEDVDTFLMHLAVTMDQRDRDEAGPDAPPHADGPVATPVAAEAEALLAEEARIAAETATAHAFRQAEVQARSVLVAAQEASQGLIEQTRLANEKTISDARATAERGLTKARQRAEEILDEAREAQLRASRAETEAGLRLAYVEERLAKKALVLSEEAKRLGALAAWLAQDDLAPADESETHQPAHAAPTTGEVVSLPRTAE